MKTISIRHLYLMLVGVVILLTTASCSSDSNDPQIGSITYAGTGTFNFTGDTTFTFQGSVDNVGIVGEFLPIFLKNPDDLTLRIGINGDPEVKAGTYVTGVKPVQAFTSITLFDELYEATSGTVIITSINENEIKGSVDTTISAFFVSSNDIFIQGTFELTAQ